MGPASSRVVIVGAGHAGSNAAAFLRQYGWPGEILLLGEEPVLPYHRPPLSKAWLKGAATAESLALRPADFYEKQRVALRLGTRVEAVDRAAKLLRLAGGEAIAYDHLILATGARARRIPLPGADRPEVLTLRNAADADRLQEALGPGRHVVVIGAGWIGLEVAASARALGARATVLEAQPRALARVASPLLSAFVEAAHRRHGVDLRLGAGVEAIEPGPAVRLADGTRLPCDLVLLGVGAVAEDALARAAGLADPAGGIRVDERARTADPAIHAIGDCTIRPLPGGAMGRLESVPSATEQAKQAAADLCGRPPPAPEVCWFWSDQYDLRIQVAGLAQGAARSLVRGDPAAADRLAVFHLDAAGAVQAMEAVNAAPEFMAGKRLIGLGRPVDADRLADPATPLAALAAA